MQNSMNEQVLLNRIVNVLEKNLGLQVQLRDTTGMTRGQVYDAILEIKINNQIAAFIIEIKNIDRFNILENIQRQDNSITPTLLVTPYISRKMAEKCKSLGIQFVDTAGNAYINAQGIYIYVAGQPRPFDARSVIRLKTISIARIRIIFALLTQPNLIRGSYREIMDASEVSLGSVGKVFSDLVHRGFISNKTKDGRKLITPRRLIDEWVNHYLKLRPKLVLQKFSSQVQDWWKQEHLLTEYGVWGGEVAAAKLTGNLKPGTVTVYVSGKPDEIIINNRLNADEQGNIEFLKMFWTPSKENISNVSDIAPVLLIYADLLASMDSRNKEIAKEIYDKYLENLFY